MRILLSLLLTMGMCASLHAQFLLNMLNQEAYRTRVKLVDEFIERFNCDEIRPDLKRDADNINRTNLLLLFDLQKLKSKKDTMFAKAEEMVDTILSNNTKISYEDNGWVAKAICHGKFKGKSIEFTMYLTVEKRGEDMYKWVISKVDGDIFRLTPSIKSGNIMILPDAHETNFMQLRRITTEKDEYITNYSSKNFVVDLNSVFYSYVYNGLLDIEYVSELEFLFFQVPNYQFAIKHIDRESSNAGWLITSFEKTTEEKKSDFLKYIYNQ